MSKWIKLKFISQIAAFLCEFRRLVAHTLHDCSQFWILFQVTQILDWDLTDWNISPYLGLDQATHAMFD